MTAQELRELLNVKPAGPEFIANPSVYERELISGYSMKSFKFNDQMDKFCPAKLGELNVIVGHANIGKTTLMLFLFAKLIKQGAKALIFSMENRISFLHEDLCRYYFNKPITSEHLEIIRSRVMYIENKNRFSCDDAIKQSTYLLDAGYEWDYFLIDPYNGLMIDNKERLPMHDYHYEMAERMRMFCMNSGKTIYLNTHTLTEAQREKYDNNGERKAPLASMTEGGAKWLNKADNVLVFHRNHRSTVDGARLITEVHVEKVRNKRFGGTPTDFDKPLLYKFRIDGFGFDEMKKQEEEKELSFNEIF